MRWPRLLVVPVAILGGLLAAYLLLFQPEFVFVSPQLVSVSPSNEAPIDYFSPAAAGAILVKVQVNAKGHTTGNYNLTATMTDPQGVSNQATHDMIVIVPGQGGDVVSTNISSAFASMHQDFRSQGGLTVKVTWTGAYNLLGIPKTFQKTALIKLPVLRVNIQSMGNGGGPMTLYLQYGPLDFPVQVSMTTTDLSLPQNPVIIPANTASATVNVTAMPPQCPKNPVVGPAGCYWGSVSAQGKPDDPSWTGPTIVKATGCADFDCIK